MARVCFFARVKDASILQRVEFYAQDLRILRSLGHEVVVATKPSELVRADLYFCWWWTWAFVPLAFARLLRRPIVITGVFDDWMFDSRPWLQRRLLARALRSSDANIFISRLEQRVVTARFLTANPSFSPCVVDSSVYAPEPGRRRERFVLTVAWLGAENATRKGIPEIIRSAALVRQRLPDVRFVIAGERGAGFEPLRMLADELGVGDIVDFRGMVTVERKIDLMRSCGVYLQPSRFEGFGLAVLEAMSCGAPLVVSNGGALPEVVSDAGVVLSCTSPQAIADALCDLLDDPIRAAEYRERARARAVKEFSLTRRRNDLQRVIDSLLHR